jgi:AAA domain
MGGSLAIVNVNNQVIEPPQYIAGAAATRDVGPTDPVAPENANEAQYFAALPFRRGLRIVVFKYTDAEGKECISVKQWGSQFLRVQHPHTLLVRGVQAVLGVRLDQRQGIFTPALSARTLPPQLAMLREKDVQAITCEIIGKSVSSLAPNSPQAPNFFLSPTYLTTVEGFVQPLGISGQRIPDTAKVLFDAANLEAYGKQLRATALQANEQHRTQHNLPLVFEDNHFANEGYNVFLLDKKGNALDRCVHFVSAPDLFQVEHAGFTLDLQNRIRAAVQTIRATGSPVNDDTLRQYLQFGRRQWNRFGKMVQSFVQMLNSCEASNTFDPSKPCVLVTVGLPGAGKSYFSEHLIEQAKSKWARINQDTMGTRQACEKAAKIELKKGSHLIVDRTNVDIWQRKVWIQLAKAHDTRNLFCLFLDVPVQVCKDRILSRVDHPTLPANQQSVGVVDRFLGSFIPPSIEEGYIRVVTASTEQEVDDAVAFFAALGDGVMEAKESESDKCSSGQQPVVCSATASTGTGTGTVAGECVDAVVSVGAATAGDAQKHTSSN